MLSKFVNFLRMEASGECWHDVTYRAYDLDRKSGRDMLRRARRQLGYSTMHELRSDLVGIGYLGPLQGPLARWYVWQGLVDGRLRVWPLRRSDRSPEQTVKTP